MDSVKIIAFILADAVLALTIIFSGLANVGKIDGLMQNSQLFPYNICMKDILAAPMNKIYGVWVFVYIYQVCWMCYALSLFFRSNAPDFLNKKFFVSFTLALVCNIIWMFIWSRQIFSLGFVFYVLQAIFLNANLYFAFSASDQYYQSSPLPVSTTFDFWCFRFLVVNGISFFTGWVSATAFVNFAVVLQSDLDVPQIPASNAALALMLICVLIWAVAQNSIWEVHTRFMFSEYISFIVVLGGIIAKKWNYEHEDVRSFALALFIIILMLFVFRIGIIITREAKRGALPSVQQEPGEDVKLI